MKTLRIILGLVVCSLVAETASAQYAEDVLRFSQFGLGVGSRTLGMGNAAVGTVNDFTSLFWNPAGLALDRNYEFSIGMSNNAISNDATYLGSTESSNKSATNLNNLGLVYPVATSRGSLTFGFGFGRVANYNNTSSFSGFNPNSSLVQSMAPLPSTDLSGYTQSDLQDFLNNNPAFSMFLADTVRSPAGNLLLVPLDTGRVQQSAAVVEGGGLNHWTFGGAVEIAKDLMVGASLNFVSGTYTYDRQFTEQDVQGVYNYPYPFNFNKFTYETSFTSDLSGFNALFGLMLKKQGRYQVGLTIRTPTHFEINETYGDNGHSYFTSGPSVEYPYDESKDSYSITTPFVFSGGVSIQATDWLLLAGDAEYTDWTQMQFDTNDPTLLDENRYIQSSMRATWNLRGGAEVTLWSLGLRLRGGYIWNPSPYIGDPSSYDQIYYTGGLGYDLDENVTLNAAVAIGKWSTFRNVYTANSVTYSTSNENINSNTVIIGLSYRF